MTPTSSPQVPANGTNGPASSGTPVPRARTVLCPYCGHVSLNPSRCEHCKGLFDPLSKQASQNAMGPWFIRDAANPFRPGCSFETLRQLIQRGKVTATTVLRGPTTRQFWMHARAAPGVANLLGECHACHRAARPEASGCDHCGAPFSVATDREFLGLAPVHLLPGMAPPETIAQAAASPGLARPSVDSLRAVLPPPSAATGMYSPGPQSFAGDADGAAAVDSIARELAVSRLERRAASLVGWLWILGVLLVLAIGAAVVAIAGPALGWNLLGADQPRSGPHSAPTSKPVATPAATAPPPPPAHGGKSEPDRPGTPPQSSPSGGSARSDNSAERPRSSTVPSGSRREDESVGSATPSGSAAYQIARQAAVAVRTGL